MNTEQQSQIIEVSLLKWVSLLVKKTVTSFQELSTGEFYIQLLSQVRSFKFIKPLKDITLQNGEQSFNLVNRISNMKVIGDSLLRFYQTYLMRDVSGVKIDYVKLCMGNRSESIKLFSLVIGVAGQCEAIEGFLEAIENLQIQDQDIVKALLENSRNIGENISKKQDSPLQKKILNKMEIYQDKIETLEIQLQSARELLEEEKFTSQSYQAEIKQLKSQKSKLIQKTQVLELLNNRLESQNSSFVLQNQNLVKKLESQKRHYDTMLAKTQQTLLSYEKEMSVLNLMKDKIQQLKSANNDLKQRFNELLIQQQEKQSKFTLMKENYKLVQDNYVKAKEKLTQVELEYQNFRFQQQQYSGVKGTAKILNSPAYHISNNSQLSSINYRVRDRLGSFINGQLSNVQMVDSNIVHRQAENSKSKLKKSTLSNQQNLMFSHLQNFSHFAFNSMTKNYNLRDIEDVSEFQGEYTSQIANEINQQGLDRSILINEEEELELRNSREKNSPRIHQKNFSAQQKAFQIKQQSFQDEQNLLVTIISDLYLKNEQMYTQLLKYKQIKTKKQQRLQIFKEKLAKIREIEPISEIDSKFQQQKENINQNGLPILFMTEKQAQYEKDYQEKSPQSSSQRYSYYPLVLN